uniref:XS domain-containing protein n=1 Tax=Salix viminalis TaxID=40686 RepID=A0A6N2NHX4_SALVM
MAGGSHPKSSTHKPSSSTPAPHSKSRWESAAANNPPPPPQSNQKLHKPYPSPKPNTGPSPKPVTPTAGPIQPPQLPPFPFPDLGPPPPPTYGFHMLERRPIVLADGTVRSYLALPSDYQDFPRPPLPPRFLHRGGHPDFPPTGPRIPPLNPDALGFQNQNQNQNKRKFEEESLKHGSSGSYNNNHSNEKNYTLRADNRGAGTSCVADEMRTGKKMRVGRGDDVGLANRNNNRNVGEVNQSELKKAFFNFVKVINENEADRKKYLEDGKQGRLRCVACVRIVFIKSLALSYECQLAYWIVTHIVNLCDGSCIELVCYGLNNIVCQSTQCVMSINPILVPLKLFGHDTVYLLHKLCYDMKIVYMLCYMSTSVKYDLTDIQEKPELLFSDALDMQNYRSSKDFPDMHALIMHTYSSDNADVRVDHLGLHKALCILMRWNYSKPPDNSKAYQFLPADEARANQDDLIMWPPMVIIHNTITGKSKDDRMEGLGNREMDSKMRDLGFAGGKSKSLYGRDGHLGITLVKFGGDQSGLKEAIRMAEHFEKDNHGRKAWGCLQPVTLGNDDEKNPSLVKVDRSGEKTRILYGYLATAADLNKVDFETRKTVVIESLREHEASK